MGIEGGDQSYLERLVTSSRCFFCGSIRGSLSAGMIEDMGDRKLMHIGCEACGHAVIAVVTFSEEGLFSVGLRTDCTSKDALRFLALRPLRADDAISAHEALAGGDSFLKALRGAP